MTSNPRQELLDLYAKVERLEELVRLYEDAMNTGAFHHQACNSNWYSNNIKPDWNGEGDGRLPQDCTCARIKIDRALEAGAKLKGEG